MAALRPVLLPAEEATKWSKALSSVLRGDFSYRPAPVSEVLQRVHRSRRFGKLTEAKLELVLEVDRRGSRHRFAQVTIMREGAEVQCLQARQDPSAGSSSSSDDFPGRDSRPSGSGRDADGDIAPWQEHRGAVASAEFPRDQLNPLGPTPGLGHTFPYALRRQTAGQSLGIHLIYHDSDPWYLLVESLVPHGLADSRNARLRQHTDEDGGSTVSCHEFNMLQAGDVIYKVNHCDLRSNTLEALREAQQELKTQQELRFSVERVRPGSDRHRLLSSAMQQLEPDPNVLLAAKLDEGGAFQVVAAYDPSKEENGGGQGYLALNYNMLVSVQSNTRTPFTNNRFPEYVYGCDFYDLAGPAGWFPTALLREVPLSS